VFLLVYWSEKQGFNELFLKIFFEWYSAFFGIQNLVKNRANEFKKERA